MSAKYDVYFSPYMDMYRCSVCGDITDQTDHKRVCGQCGGTFFNEFVGRWEARFKRPRLLTDLLEFLTMDVTRYDKRAFVVHEKKETES